MTPQRLHAKVTTEARIVEAAVQLFSRQGYSGTSTREIARLADVNEVTIYRIFTRKEDLFWEAVDSQLSGLRFSQSLREALEGDGQQPEFVISLVFEFLVDIVVRQPELIRLIGFSALELGSGAEGMARKHLSPIFSSLAAYLERCGERGTLRRGDLFITVLSFAATVIAKHSIYEIVTGHESQVKNMHDAVAAYTKYWTQALLPHEADIDIQPEPETGAALEFSEETVSSS